MVVVFWADIPVEVTQDASVVPRRRRAAIGKLFLVASYDTQGKGGCTCNDNVCQHNEYNAWQHDNVLIMLVPDLLWKV